MFFFVSLSFVRCRFFLVKRLLFLYVNFIMTFSAFLFHFSYVHRCQNNKFYVRCIFFSNKYVSLHLRATRQQPWWFDSGLCSERKVTRGGGGSGGRRSGVAKDWRRRRRVGGAESQPEIKLTAHSQSPQPAADLHNRNVLPAPPPSSPSCSPLWPPPPSQLQAIVHRSRKLRFSNILYRFS